jgi:predicted amidohydrolase
MASRNGDPAGNLTRALSFVEEAAGLGAQLILLPELMPTGYLFSDELWDAAEPTQGLTARWLREQARRLGVHLGTSFLEADGEDFFNTFVLATPEGAEATRALALPDRDDCEPLRRAARRPCGAGEQERLVPVALVRLAARRRVDLPGPLHDRRLGRDGEGAARRRGAGHRGGGKPR